MVKLDVGKIEDTEYSLSLLAERVGALLFTYWCLCCSFASPMKMNFRMVHTLRFIQILCRMTTQEDRIRSVSHVLCDWNSKNSWEQSRMQCIHSEVEGTKPSFSPSLLILLSLSYCTAQAQEELRSGGPRGNRRRWFMAFISEDATVELTYV